MLILSDIFNIKHLIGVIYVIALSIGLFYVLKKSNVSSKKFAFVFMIVFYILEGVKIGYLWYGSDYPINHLPFHLCSTPLYLFPIYYFSKENSFLERVAMASIYGVVFMAGIVALIMPTNIIGSESNWYFVKDNFLPFISFTYHGLMVITPIYMLRHKFYNFQYKDYFLAMIPTILLTLTAVIVNQLLDTDFMLLNRGGGSPFQFLIEISRGLYIFSMIVLGFFIVHVNFFITWIVKKID